MSQCYNDSHSWKQIVALLKTIKHCVKADRFFIAKNENRQENMDFITRFNLHHKRQREILLEIEPDDFCHSLKNKNPGYEHEVLYVFCPQVKLFEFGSIEPSLVDIYIKLNLIDTDNGKRAIVISSHKRNRPIDYLFR